MSDTEQPAGLARRLGAMLYDSMLVLAIWMMTLFPMVALSNEAATGSAVRSLLFFELVAFFVFFWYFRGQTLGMLAWRLELRSATGHAITPLQLIVRVFAAGLSFACAGMGYLWILFDPDRRSWADIISQTRVMYTPNPPKAG